MYKMNALRFILLVFAVTTSVSLTLKKANTSEIVFQCILSILDEYFSDAKKIHLRYNDNQCQMAIVRQLIRHTDLPIMMNAEEYPMGVQLDNRIPNDVIIILNEDVNVVEYLENNLYTARTVFLTVFWEKSEEISGKFAAFWNYNIVNSYALKIMKDEVHVYHYSPYFNCNTSTPILLDVWSEGVFRYGRIDVIKKKYPVNHMNGCTLIVSVPHIPPTIIFPEGSKLNGSNVISGIEGRMWTTISEKINCTFRYKIPDDGGLWGFLTPKPTGALGEIIQKKSHLAGGGPAPTLERITYLDSIIGTSGTTDLVVWAVPIGAGKSQPVWLRLYIVEFTALTWIFLALILLFAVLLYTSFSRLTRTHSTSGLLESFLLLFSASLRGSVKMPRSLSLKVFIEFWMWYTLIIMTAYESAMRSTLTVPIRHKEINTFQEIVESGIDLYGIDTTITIVLTKNIDSYEDAMAKNGYSYEYAMARKVKVWNSSTEEIIKRIARDKDVGYMREKLTLDYFLFNHIELIGSIHQAKQYLYIYYQSIFMSKRFPIKHRIQKIVSQLRESGILTWWRREYTRENHSTQPKAVKLTIEHMTAPFTLLGVGTLIATIAFFAEQLKIRTNQDRRKFEVQPSSDSQDTCLKIAD